MSQNRLLRWQLATLAVLVSGYAGYYVCRSNFSVALPLLPDELAAEGLTRDAATLRLGAVASLGVLAYALGGGLPLFTLAWMGNRWVQSLGWVGMVKLASRWFPYGLYGTARGAISLSFLFGDAAARAFMGALITYGLGWPSLRPRRTTCTGSAGTSPARRACGRC